MLKAVCIALSTYSILPVPLFPWTEKDMRYSLCMLPLVGLFIGAFLWLWHWLCGMLEIGGVLFAAVAAVLPLIVTGGIHMDGFCDTVDALSSRQSRERKLEILKDSHVGAFAVMGMAGYLLISFGLYTELIGTAGIPIICVGFVFSRALAVLSVLTLGNARGGGMLFAFTDLLARRASCIVTIVFLFLSGAGMLLLRWQTGALCLLLCGGWFFFYRRLVKKQFGGVTGDTTGFFSQITELLLLVGVVVSVLLERIGLV